ncbi:MAG: Hsp70 family protein [Spirochaetales bacterium]|nr:Hsp70 family protein [Spirochaetales bacterium]
MNDSTIGIKIADGSYYPILGGEKGSSKRVVLTTVRDNQESVQIDLYKGQGESLENARYIGSLMIENIETAEKGEPEVELIVGVDKNGNLNATAGDHITGEKQSLSVSLTALEASDTYDMPDFEIENDIGTVSPDEESRLTAETYEDDDEEEEWQEEEEEEDEKESKKKHPVLLIGFIILALAVLAVLGVLLFKNLRGEEVPPLEAGGTVVSETVAEAPAEEPPAAEKPSAVVEPAAEEPPAAVAETTEPPAPAQSAIPPAKTGLWYRIAWGDTLWDISYAFYKNPWLYPVIAKENDIRNPDFILAETSIFIPAR